MRPAHDRVRLHQVGTTEPACREVEEEEATAVQAGQEEGEGEGEEEEAAAGSVAKLEDRAATRLQRASRGWLTRSLLRAGLEAERERVAHQLQVGTACSPSPSRAAARR